MRPFGAKHLRRGLGQAQDGDWLTCSGRGTVELREKAVEVALAVTSGAYQTSLLTYFIQRDLFPSVMKASSLVSGKGGRGANTSARS